MAAGGGPAPPAVSPSGAAAQAYARFSVCSDVFLCWLLPTIRRGLPGNPLRGGDCPELPEPFASAKVREQTERLWAAELAAGTCSVWRVLWKMWWRYIVPWVWWNVLQGLLSAVARPLLLKWVIQAMTREDSQTATIYIGVLGAVLCLEGVSATYGRYSFTAGFGGGYMMSMGQLIHAKALRLDAASQSSAASARSLVGGDIMRTYENLRGLGQTPSSVVQVIAGTIVVVHTIGVKGLTGLGLLYLTMAVNKWFANATARAEKRNLSASDARLALMTRVVEGAKAMKLCAWEEKFLAQLQSLRKEECRHIRRYRMLQNVSAQLGRACPVMASALTFVFLVATGEDLDAASVFATVTVFQTLRLALIMLPLSMSLLASLRVNGDRITEFLLRDELPTVAAEEQHAVSVDRADLCWPDDVKADRRGREGLAKAKGDGASKDKVLRGVSFAARRGEVTAIVGAVGSGKTTLVTAVMGGLVPALGSVRTARPAAYVPQKAFIIAGTLRDNICYGRPCDEQWLAEVLHATTLDVDCAELPGGLDTEIGERGVTLSGGQQQRVAVARAVYARPALLVLDDPLAAVDPQVGHAIFSRVVARRQPGQSVLIALNQLHFAARCDHVVFLDKGEIAEQGTYEELMARKGRFAGLVQRTTGCNTEKGADPDTPRVEPEAAARGGDKETGKLVRSEARAQGAVAASVLRRYLAAMGASKLAALAALTVCTFALMGFSDRWLSMWTASFEGASPAEAPEAGGGGGQTPYMEVYIVACALYTIFLLLLSWAMSIATVHGARRLHDDCALKVFHAPVEWFNETPSGRIISRFSSDLTKVDIQLSISVDTLVQLLGSLLVLTVIICWIIPKMVPVMLSCAVLYYLQVIAVDRTNREFKRHANAEVAPVLTSLGEVASIHGRLVAHSLGHCDHARDTFARQLEQVVRWNYLSVAVQHWGMLTSYVLSSIVSLSAAIFMVYVGSHSSSDVGLALAYSFLLPYFLLMLSLVGTQFKALLTSLERLLEFSGDQVPQEAEWRRPEDARLAGAWPTKGAVTFSAVSLVYRAGLAPAVKRVSFEIEGGERVGVVGRTGAGKSSLVLLLWRIEEATAGSIRIDGVDIAAVGLQTLRQCMGIIPQEPLVVSGTVRDNLDPFQQHSDAELSMALEKVGMGAGLLAHSAGRLSHGQRQLLSVARVLVRNVAIVVMDEPTSNVDMATDEHVQRAVRSELGRCTVITIAHRLHTIIDADRILVMDHGQVAEFGAPAELLALPLGHLRAMASGLGGGGYDDLVAKAGAAARARQMRTLGQPPHCPSCTCPDHSEAEGASAAGAGGAAERADTPPPVSAAPSPPPDSRPTTPADGTADQSCPASPPPCDGPACAPPSEPSRGPLRAP